MAIPDPIEGVAVAWDDDWNEEAPSWSRLDDNPGYRVQEFEIDRGRDYEMDTTDTGRAIIRLKDKVGDFDPTNVASALAEKLDPGKPAGIGLWNPVASRFNTIFRGNVASITSTLHRTKRWMDVEIELVDGLNQAARMELVPEAPFDAGGSSINGGNIVYDEDLTTDAVQTRILAALDQMGWPTALRQIFTGNVKLWETTYAPRTALLNVIRDAADAEFPGVANVYINRQGDFTFHGRLARFNPQTTADNNHETSSTEWEFESWVVGDDHACSLDPDCVRLAPPLVWSRDEENLYTSAIATDKNIDDDDIAGQYVEDATQIGKVGTRTWSAEGLLTAGGEGTTAIEETAKFSTYYRDNYARALTRVPVITVVSQDPAGRHGEATWRFLSRVDISDVVRLKTFHPWGTGGFDDDFYVEGVHYQARKGPGRFLIVECRVDLSPAGYYDFNPWEGS